MSAGRPWRSSQNLQIQPKALAKTSIVLQNILLANEEKAKMMTGSVCTTTNWIHENPEDKGYVTWSTHGSHQGATGFFSKFGQIGYVYAVASKACIAIGDYVLQITMDRKEFFDIP